jgi:hypothetical protein
MAGREEVRRTRHHDRKGFNAKDLPIKQRRDGGRLYIENIFDLSATDINNDDG